MRTFGFVIIGIGILIGVLGVQGKMAAAWSALKTGTVSSGNTSTDSNSVYNGQSTAGTASGNYHPAYPGGPLMLGH